MLVSVNYLQLCWGRYDIDYMFVTILKPRFQFDCNASFSYCFFSANSYCRGLLFLLFFLSGRHWKVDSTTTGVTEKWEIIPVESKVSQDVENWECGLKAVLVEIECGTLLVSLERSKPIVNAVHFHCSVLRDALCIGFVCCLSWNFWNWISRKRIVQEYALNQSHINKLKKYNAILEKNHCSCNLIWP